MSETWADLQAKVDQLLGAPELKRDIERRTNEVIGQRYRIVARPSAVADRLKQLKADIEAKSDALMAEIEGVASTAVPNAFAKGKAFLDGLQADVKGLEDELSQLTNLPLGPSTNAGS